MKDGFMLFGYDRKRTSTLTLDSQPGAHTGATRKYIPGYSSSNIVYLNTSTGNDANDGSTALLAKQTYASAATAASTTKKIRLVNSATLTDNITKPTEATIGTTSIIKSSSLTAPVDTWTQAGTPSFSTSTIKAVLWVPFLSKYFAFGQSGKIAYSSDGNTWNQVSVTGFGSEIISAASQSIYEKFIIASSDSGSIRYSTNGITWSTATTGTTDSITGIVWSDALGIGCAVTNLGHILRSSTPSAWELIPDLGGAPEFTCVSYSETNSIFLAGTATGDIYTSPDGATWTAVASPSTSGAAINYILSDGPKIVAIGEKVVTSTDAGTWTHQAGAPFNGGQTGYGGVYSKELAKYIICGTSGIISYSDDAITWTDAGTPSFGATTINACAVGVVAGKSIAVADSGKIAYSTAYATTISAAVAGFSIQAVQYSGTVTAYNCTLKQPGTTAALSLDSCRVTESGSHISNNAVTSTATLYEGDRHTTCTPASQNAIDCNLDTVGGTWYIYNASATAYERIRDCLVEGGIVANYNVTVSGRANVRGTSSNVLFGSTVTHRDPKFVDTTDYKLQFQSNGYARNSLAAGRSALYFNSAGDARDIGAWSYVESAVSYYFAKNVYLPKGQITHSVEEVVSEQQGDSGAVSVYGNVNRIKEVITIKYNTEAEEDFAVVRAMRLLTDKTVLIQLDPAWSANAGSVVANGNHSAGADVLNIDAAATYNGMTVTISGKTYYPLRMYPDLTATTRLILDRPLEDAVSDNDVITRNYPSGAGEYQYAAQSRLDLARIDATVMTGYRSGFIIRLVRAYQ